MRWLSGGKRRGIWLALLKEATDNMSAILEERSRTFGSAIILGGCTGGQLAAETALEDYWRTAKPEMARSVSEIFSLCVLSIWLDKMDAASPHAGADDARARLEWGGAALDAFRDPSREVLEWFLNWHRQFRHEKVQVMDPEHQTNLFPCYSMLTDMCIASLGGPAAQFPRAGFPFTGLEDYRTRGHGDLTCWDPVAVVMVGKSLVKGYELSVEFYNQPPGTP